MQSIFFPGNTRQPCQARYGILLPKEGGTRIAQIVVVQSDKDPYMGTSLWNTDEGRNLVLNRILETDLRGVRVEYIRFATIIHSDDGLHAIDLPIELDIDDYVAKGNRYDVGQAPAQDWIGVLRNLVGRGNKQYGIWSGDVVGGCARFYMDFEERKHLNATIAREWLEALGFPHEIVAS